MNGRALGVAVGLLFVGLALVGMDERGWAEYARLSALVAALLLGLLGERRIAGDGVGAPLSAAALTGAAAQLSLPADSWSDAIMWGSLAVLAWFGAAQRGGAVSRRFPGVLSRLEWTAVVAGMAVLAVSLAVTALPGMQSLWPRNLQWVIYPAVWIGLARWMAVVAPGDRRWLVGPVASVLAIVCIGGGACAANALYQLRSARSAAASGDFEAAASRYRRAGETGGRLGLKGVQDKAKLGLATSLAGHGAVEEGQAVLGIHEGQTITIGPDQWEGPTGALLFKSVSCWTEVWLWQGTVEVEIRAYGRPARDEWPRVRVELAGVDLGEMEVGSAEVTAQTFTTSVATGKHWVQLSLVKGFWSSRGELRWARLDTVRLRYPNPKVAQ